MKRLSLFVLLAGCTGSSPAQDPGGEILTGFPGKPKMAVSDQSGRWDGIDHWIVDPSDQKEHDPSNGGAKMSIYRGTLPFPQFSWGTGDFEVTQLLFPVGDGFMARYHVMNHGNESRTVRLVVGRRDRSALPPLVSQTRPTETSTAQWAYDLKIDAGASEFVVLSTPEAAGRDPNDALDEATTSWEKLLERPITISDSEALSAYCLDLAGRALGLSGRAEAVRKFEEKFVKKEGDTIRLLAGVPEAWLLETIEVKGMKTEHGLLSFRHVGFYNYRTLELDPGCAPPGGFLLAVDSVHKAKVDGKDCEVTNGVLRLPSGTKRVELARKF